MSSPRRSSRYLSPPPPQQDEDDDDDSVSVASGSGGGDAVSVASSGDAVVVSDGEIIGLMENEGIIFDERVVTSETLRNFYAIHAALQDPETAEALAEGTPDIINAFDQFGQLLQTTFPDRKQYKAIIKGIERRFLAIIEIFMEQNSISEMHIIDQDSDRVHSLKHFARRMIDAAKPSPSWGGFLKIIGLLSLFLVLAAVAVESFEIRYQFDKWFDAKIIELKSDADISHREHRDFRQTRQTQYLKWRRGLEKKHGAVATNAQAESRAAAKGYPAFVEPDPSGLPKPEEVIGWWERRVLGLGQGLRRTAVDTLEVAGTAARVIGAGVSAAHGDIAPIAATGVATVADVAGESLESATSTADVDKEWDDEITFREYCEALDTVELVRKFRNFLMGCLLGIIGFIATVLGVGVGGIWTLIISPILSGRRRLQFQSQSMSQPPGHVSSEDLKQKLARTHSPVQRGRQPHSAASIKEDPYAFFTQPDAAKTDEAQTDQAQTGHFYSRSVRGRRGAR